MDEKYQNVIDELFSTEKKDTRVFAPELKRVYTTDLKIDMHKDLKEKWKDIEKERSKCMLYHLTMHASCEELNTYVTLCHNALVSERSYPDNTLEVKNSDYRVCQEMTQAMLTSDVALFKIAFIWLFLFVATKKSVFSIFCPDTAGSTFLCDPDKLDTFLYSPSSATFRQYVGEFLTGVKLFSTFVEESATLWFELCPWEDMDTYRTLDPTDTSVGIKRLLETTKRDNERRKIQYIEHDKRQKLLQDK